MKKKGLPTVAFAFKFTPLMLVLCVLGFALCAASIGFSTWQFSEFLRNGNLQSPYEWIKYVLWYGASIALAVLIAAMLIRSRYTLTADTLTLQLGFIRQKFGIAKIYSVHLFRGAKKLAVYFDDFHTDFIAVVIREEDFDAFVRELTLRSPRIGFTFSTAEEEEEFKKKK